MFPQRRRAFHVAQQVIQKVVRIGEAGVLMVGVDLLVAVLLVSIIVAVIIASTFVRLTIVEDDDFVDTEDGAGSCDLAYNMAFCVVVLSTVSMVSEGRSREAISIET